MKTPLRRRAIVASLLLSPLTIPACYVDTVGSGSTGGGGGGATTCQPGATESCYDGPAGTEGVGICAPGVRTCQSDGRAFGPCIGSVEPRDEKCETPEDEDCSGAAETEFPGCCVPNSIVGCYTGPEGTMWVGPCTPGTKVCNEAGTAFGECSGEVLPQEETCETPIDDNCNGATNEGVSNCCQAGDTQDCYTGPAGSEGVGICLGGTRYCKDDGSGFGPCEGEITPKAEKCDTFDIDESCNGASGCTGSHIWSKRFGDKIQSGTAIADLSSNIILFGSFQETTDLGNGTLTSAGADDVYIAKFDPKGNTMFSKRFGNASPQKGESVTVDAEGNIFIVGSFQGSIDLGGGSLLSAGGDDVFVAKLDSKGKHIWSKRFGGPGTQTGLFLGVDSFGYTTVAGTFSGSVDFGDGIQTSAGGDDIFVFNLDPDGYLLWTVRAGGIGSDGVGGMVVDVQGNIYLTGRFSTTIDFGGGTLTSLGGDDLFVASLDYYGGHLFSQRAGDIYSQTGTGITLGPSGEIYVIGDFQGTMDLGGGPVTSAGGADIFVAMFDSSGTPAWVESFGDASDQRAGGVWVDASASALLTGQFQGSVDFGVGPMTSAGGNDIYVVKLDAGGTALWGQRFGDGSFAQVGKSVTSDASGNVIVAGTFGGGVNFGGGLLQAKGTTNTFLLKLEP